MANKNFEIKNGLTVAGTERITSAGLLTGTTSTQAASDNTTKLASTAYVTTALANLADSAPSTLNTLNELAAALGDDANYATTTTNAIATKAPLASPTFTGTIKMQSNGAYFRDGVGNSLSSGWDATGDDHSTWINFEGYQGGTTKFRDLRIGNGKQSAFVHFDGSAASVTISGALTVTGEVRTTNLNTASSTGTLVMYGGATNKGGMIELSGGNNTGATGSGIVFKTGPSTANPAERMRILSGGNVGIGTTNPQDTLHVVTDSSTTNDTVDVVRIEATSSGTPAVGFGPAIDFRAERAGSAADSVGRLGFVADIMTASRVDGAFVVETAIDGAYTERLRIDSTGRAGIGRTPSIANSKLEVGGADNVSLINVEASGATGGMGIGSTGLQFFHGSSSKMAINSSGQTLIFKGESGGVAPNSDSSLVLENSSHTYLQFLTPSNKDSGILFGDAASANPAQITYSHSTDDMSITAADNINLSADILNYSNAAGTGYLHMTGSSSRYADAGFWVADNYQLEVGQAHIYIKTQQAKNLTLGTSNTPRLTILADGKIGIGTANPAAALEVARGGAGYIAMFGAPHGSGKVVLFKDNHASPNKYNWLVGSQYNTNNAFEITPSTVVGGYTFNQPSITVLPTGKVGIGTNAPANMLDVKASGNDQGIMLKSTNNSNLIWLHQQSTSEGVLRIYGSGGAKVIIPGHNSPTYFNNGNNVGIGITDPDHKLEIYSGDYTTLKLRAPSYPTIKFEAINQNSGNGASIGVGANNALGINPNNSTTGMVVANNGDVGIGGSPGNAGKLTVYDNSTSNCGIRTRTGTSTHYTNVATTHTAVTANRYWHIKTNFYSTNNIMFVARVHGYSYGNSGHIVDIQRSGYAYAAHGQITGSQSVNNGSSSDTLTTYFASDNRLCFKHASPGGGYYNGYSLDFKTLSPTGYHWDFEVLDHVINATSGNHF